MHLTSFAEEVTYQRAALLLGLRSPEDVHAWAESALAADPAPSEALIDAVLAPRELTALRAALAPVALDREPAAVVQRLLVAIAADVRAGRRSLDDTMHVLAQLRRLIAVPRDIAHTLDDLAAGYMLAAAGVERDLADERARVADWLARYDA